MQVTNSVPILAPSHFVTDLGRRLEDTPVRLIPYDREGRPLEPSEDATGLFRWWITVEQGDALISSHPRLDWIHTGSTGVDHILTETFLRRNIVLTNSRGVHAPSIAEWVIAMILYWEKNVPLLADQQRQLHWQQIERPELSSRAITILGGGAIARAIASRLRPFGVRMVVVTRSGRSSAVVDLVLPSDRIGETLEVSDWVIVALPLTAETRGLLGRGVLDRVKHGARLVNIARGEIVDQHLVVQLLASGQLAGAVLDVFEHEPLPQDDPLWTMPGVSILPHTSWKSPEVRERQLDLFVRNARRKASGEPLENVVDTRRGY